MMQESQVHKSQDRSAALLRILAAFVRDSGLPAPQGGVGLDTRLEAELGLDSIGRSELLTRIEQGLDLELPEAALLAATPRDLLGYLPGNLSGLAGAPGEIRAAQKTPTGRPVATGPGGEPSTARTLLDLLEWHLARHPERVHIRYQGADERIEPITYADLKQGAARVAARLGREGIRSGDRVALMLPTGPDYFYSFIGILAAGGIPVPIYPPARPQQIEDHLRRHARILVNAGAGFLITVPQARAVARLLGIQVPSLRGLLTLDTSNEVPDDAADAGVPPWEPDRPAADAIAFLQYTSGSTGDPKGVMLTHADLLANIRAMGQAAGVGADDVFVSWLPLYHDMGLIGAWLSGLYFGMTLLVMSPLAFLPSRGPGCGPSTSRLAPFPPPPISPMSCA